MPGARGPAQAELVIGGRQGDAALRGALEVALHDEEGFMDLLQGAGFFADGDGEGGDTGGPTLVADGKGFEEAHVHLIEAIGINLKHVESGISGFAGDAAIRADLGVVPDPAEEVIGDARGAAGAAGDLEGAVREDLQLEEPGAAGDDVSKVSGLVVVQPQAEAEAAAEGAAEHAGAGGGADEGEAGQVELDGTGTGSLINDDVQPVVLQGGIKILFNGGLEAVNLINEEDVTALKISEEPGEVSGFFDHGAAGDLYIGVHLLRDDVSEGGLTESGRAAEEKMIQNVPAIFGGLHAELEALADFVLALKIIKGGGTQIDLKEHILLDERVKRPLIGKAMVRVRRCHDA